MSKIQLMIVGILVLVFVGAGTFMLATRTTQQTVGVTPTPTPIAQPTSNPQITSTIPQVWFTYVDPQKRYQVNYPSDWDYVIFSETLHLGSKAMITQIKSELAKGYPEIDVPSGITITDKSSPMNPANNKYEKTITKQITVSGIPATEYMITYLQSIGFANAGDVDTIVVVKQQNNTWVISPKDNNSKQIFDQMLATFKFTAT